MTLPLGYKHSTETKRKISEAKSGENHHFYGKPRSEEDKRKISEALKGRKNRRGTGADYIVKDPQGTVYIVKNLRDFCKQQWPDDYKNAQSYINITAKTHGTFFKGWTSRFVEDSDG